LIWSLQYAGAGEYPAPVEIKVCNANFAGQCRLQIGTLEKERG
jgi:hypothetical protein